MGARNRVLALVAVTAIALAGCAQYTQTTSGAEYLKGYTPAAGTALPAASSIDQDVYKTAAVEPLLRFPARIGLARIAKGTARWDPTPELTGVPAEEAKAWTAVAQQLGPSFGEFVPVSPLLARGFTTARAEQGYRDNITSLIQQIRLGAARQHLDAVLIYESDGTADSKNTPLSIAEWTLIGGFILPTQNTEAVGTANALLLDVRNGYSYGMVYATADDSALGARFNTDESERNLAEAVRLSAVQKLAPEVERMMRDLRLKLAESRQARR